MIIRSLFGLAFSGEALIENALNPKSDLAQLAPDEAAEMIRSHIHSLNSADAYL